MGTNNTSSGVVWAISKVGDIRNQHIYVVDYVSAKRHKMFGFPRFFFLDDYWHKNT